eukprot:22635-Eustigmatos_ZCMA.PRE.1
MAVRGVRWLTCYCVSTDVSPEGTHAIELIRPVWSRRRQNRPLCMMFQAHTLREHTCTILVALAEMWNARRLPKGQKYVR